MSLFCPASCALSIDHNAAEALMSGRPGGMTLTGMSSRVAGRAHVYSGAGRTQAVAGPDRGREINRQIFDYEDLLKKY